MADQASADDPELVFALDEAIQRLEAHDSRITQVVRLRFYAGLSVEETAAVLGVAPRTVKRDWAFARAWLYETLGGSEGA